MLLNILTWVVVGVLAGFLAFIILPGQRKFFFGTIVAGVVGAFVGGILYSAIKIGAIAASLDPVASAVAVLGSIILIYFIRMIIDSENKKELKN